MHNLATRRAFTLALLVAGCGRDSATRGQRPDSAAIARVRAESTTASAVAARPAAALWDVDRVSERLVRSGVAPRRIDPVPAAPPFFSSATGVGAFAVGRGGELRVFVFRDSVARRRVTATLDPVTASPRGSPSAWSQAPLLIAVQNLAAIMMGGNATLQERVQLALEAGISGK